MRTKKKYMERQFTLPYLCIFTPSKENHTVSYVKRVLGGGALYSAVWVKIPSPPYPWIQFMYTKNQAYSHETLKDDVLDLKL
jgi:hypothetical protein